MPRARRRATLQRMTGDGWSGLFESAFSQSRNPMVLVDADRVIVDVNAAFAVLLGRGKEAMLGRRLFAFVADGPLATPSEWRESLRKGRFTGEASLVHAGGAHIAVQWAAVTEVATGRRLVLFVALNTSRWGARFRREEVEGPPGTLTRREREVVRHIALGGASPEIASALGISHQTVRTHASNAMTKLGARSRAHLVAKVLAEGHVEA
jgi:PAS domain S-box-containing protein